MLRLMNGHLLVAWPGLDQVAAAGADGSVRDLVPGSKAGLVYGREVRAPIAVVLDAGGQLGLAAGEQVVTLRRDADIRLVDGVETQAVATRRVEHITKGGQRVERQTRLDPIVAVWRGDAWQAVGRRIVGEIVDKPAAGLLVEVGGQAPAMLRLEVDSVGPEVDGIEPGYMALVPADARSRMEWHDAAGDWCSVVALDVDAVEPGGAA